MAINHGIIFLKISASGESGGQNSAPTCTKKRKVVDSSRNQQYFNQAGSIEQFSQPTIFQSQGGENILEVGITDTYNVLVKEPFPYLDMKHLSKTDQEKLTNTLRADTCSMSYKFEDLTMVTFDSLQEQCIPVGELVAVALNYSQHHSNLPSLHENHAPYDKMATVYDVQTFLVQNRLISFINYRIVEKIIKRWKTDAVLTSLKRYLEAFEKFSKRSVFRVPADVITKPTSSKETQLVVKIMESQFSVADIYVVQINIAKVLDLDPEHLFVRDIRKGCIQLTFGILSGAGLFPLTSSQIEELLHLGIHVQSNAQNVSSQLYEN